MSITAWNTLHVLGDAARLNDFMATAGPDLDLPGLTGQPWNDAASARERLHGIPDMVLAARPEPGYVVYRYYSVLHAPVSQLQALRQTWADLEFYASCIVLGMDEAGDLNLDTNANAVQGSGPYDREFSPWDHDDMVVRAFTCPGCGGDPMAQYLPEILLDEAEDGIDEDAELLDDVREDLDAYSDGCIRARGAAEGISEDVIGTMVVLWAAGDWVAGGWETLKRTAEAL